MKEWPEDTYPPWAHGPGYVVSGDIARTIYKQHTVGQLKVCIPSHLLIVILMHVVSHDGQSFNFLTQESCQCVARQHM